MEIASFFVNRIMTSNQLPSAQDKIIQVVAAVAHDEQRRILLARRKSMLHCGGLWEFPGGKVEEGEIPAEALKRELAEEFDVKADVEEFVGAQVYDYGTKKINLMAYWVRLENTNMRLTDHDRVLWLDIANLDTVELAPADVFLVKIIKSAKFLA